MKFIFYYIYNCLTNDKCKECPKCKSSEKATKQLEATQFCFLVLNLSLGLRQYLVKRVPLLLVNSRQVDIPCKMVDTIPKGSVHLILNVSIFYMRGIFSDYVSVLVNPLPHVVFDIRGILCACFPLLPMERHQAVLYDFYPLINNGVPMGEVCRVSHGTIDLHISCCPASAYKEGDDDCKRNRQYTSLDFVISAHILFCLQSYTLYYISLKQVNLGYFQNTNK